MKLKPLKREMSYYPTCFDVEGEEVKQADRVEVTFKSYPSGLQLSEYKTFSIKDGATTIGYKYVDIILNHVEKIKNLQIGEDKIETAVQLCDYEDTRLYDLMVDIRNKLFDETEVLTEGES